MIEKVIEFLKEHLYSTDVVGFKAKKYRFEHSIRVANYAKEIAIKENANVKVCTLAGLLHDVGKFDTEINAEHARISGKVARPFLETLDLTEKEINDITFAISAHFDGKAGYDYENIIEADIVSDADNIDRFDVLRVYSDLNDWDIDALELDDLKDKLSTRIERLKKLIDTIEFSTPTSTALFKENLKGQVFIYEKLLKQYNISNVESILK